MSQERLKIRDLHEGDPEYVPDGDPPVYHPMVLLVDGWESVTPGDELVSAQALEAALEEARAFRDALTRIRDHGETHDEPCWAIHNGDCADVMQEIARSVLARGERG